ncbi:hypothetical protein U1Q18_051022 [Sarracenia purpurea var. burkii]
MFATALRITCQLDPVPQGEEENADEMIIDCAELHSTRPYDTRAIPRLLASYRITDQVDNFDNVILGIDEEKVRQYKGDLIGAQYKNGLVEILFHSGSAVPKRYRTRNTVKVPACNTPLRGGCSKSMAEDGNDICSGNTEYEETRKGDASCFVWEESIEHRPLRTPAKTGRYGFVELHFAGVRGCAQGSVVYRM